MNDQLANLLRTRRDTIIEHFTHEAGQGESPFYATMDQGERRAGSAALVDIFVRSLGEGQQLLITTVEQIARQRIREGARADEVQQMAIYLRNALLYTLDQADLDLLTHSAYSRIIEAAVNVGSLAINRSFSTYFTQMQAELADRQQVIQIQSRLITELSTPVLPVYDRILVMPLVGAIDSKRAMIFMERMLMAIGQYQADTIIVDITAVSVVDTAVANHILQAARAATLLGAHCVLVGIRPEVAQALVGLGVDVSVMATRSDLRAGISYALHRQGLKIDRTRGA